MIINEKNVYFVTSPIFLIDAETKIPFDKHYFTESVLKSSLSTTTLTCKSAMLDTVYNTCIEVIENLITEYIQMCNTSGINAAFSAVYILNIGECMTETGIHTKIRYAVY